MTTLLRTLPLVSGRGALAVLPALREVIQEGGEVAWLPVPAGDERETARLVAAMEPQTPIADEVALVVSTSGTTGVPKGAMLTAAALRASGEATHARLGGPGQWLLALPAHHIAGMQVLLRSVLADSEPAVVEVSEGFRPANLVSAIAAMTGSRRYTSLVPTQLVRALDDPAATAALADLDAVLVGGAATTPSLYDRARAAGIPIIRTYGMSETCGGCVYDGVALEGVRVRIEDSRVLLGGAPVAMGYRNSPGHPAFAQPGWFRTDDLGTYENGTLRILGRADDVITTGGLSVVPHLVEAVLATHPAVAECVVFGIPDEQWGETVAVAVVPAPGTEPTLAALRDHVHTELDATAAPRDLLLLDELPLLGPGKPDRTAIRRRVLTSR